MKSALSLLRVGVDLDGVLNNLGETILAELKTRGWAPLNFSPDQITAYNFEECVPDLTKEQVYSLFETPYVFWNAQVDITAREVMKDLDEQGIQLHIVTSRDFSPLHRQVTEEWLRVNGIPYHRLAIYGKQEKPIYAESQKLDIFIEDHLPTAETMADLCRVSILLDQPYNRWTHPSDWDGKPSPEPANLLRMYSWKEISKFFLGY